MSSERGDDAERANGDEVERSNGDDAERANDDDAERVNGDGGGNEGYVHRPGERGLATERDGSGDAPAHGASPSAADRELSALRGWVLVGVLGFSLLVAPLVILWRPPGIPYWAALLALPMLPAFLLGAVGVWATTRP